MTDNEAREEMVALFEKVAKYTASVYGVEKVLELGDPVAFSEMLNDYHESMAQSISRKTFKHELARRVYEELHA